MLSKALEVALNQCGVFEYGICDRSTADNCVHAGKTVETAFDYSSVIVCAFPYFSGHGNGNISLYARGRDYHKVISARLERAAGQLGDVLGRHAVLVDRSPFDEVGLACAVGLAYRGKNNLAISEKYGSYFFIGEIVAEKELGGRLAASSGTCGECTRCISSCPTAALSSNGYDPSLCLSSITQKKVLSEDELSCLRRSRLIWGCDACQLNCPKNVSVCPTSFPEFKENLIHSLELDDIAALSDRQFRKKYADYAFSWRGRSPLKRNLERAAADSAD